MTLPIDIAYGLHAHDPEISDAQNAIRSLLKLWTAGAIPIFANNAAAIAGGLTVGMLYRTNADPDTVCVVH